MGVVTSHKDGNKTVFTIKPSGRGIPAVAYVNWGSYFTWEKMSDLKFL